MNPDEPYGPLIDHGASGLFQQFMESFRMLGTVGLVVVGIMLAVWLLVLGSIAWRVLRYWRARPERAPAVCIGRRVQVRGGVDASSSSTSYYATFEFSDGSRRELRLSGRDHGMLAEGDEGVLSWRLDVFQGLQRGPVLPRGTGRTIGGPVG